MRLDRRVRRTLRRDRVGDWAFDNRAAGDRARAPGIAARPCHARRAAAAA